MGLREDTRPAPKLGHYRVNRRTLLSLLGGAIMLAWGMNFVSGAYAAAPKVEGPWATNVTAESATLGSKVNPQSANTEYSLEYGTDTSYGGVVVGTIPIGEGAVSVSHNVQGLKPATTYHYRITASNQFGVVITDDHTFTTQRLSSGSVLSDGREWELVSPANKHGALIEDGEGAYDIQSAADGRRIAYVANEPLTEHIAGRTWSFQEIVSQRASAGWESEEVAVPATLLPETSAGLLGTQSTLPPALFSADLSRAVVVPGAMTPPLSTEATERTLYLRNNDFCLTAPRACYTPLVTPLDAPGAVFGSEDESMLFMGASVDLSHVVFEDPAALTPEAYKYPLECGNCEPLENLYEWHDDALKLINVFGSGPGRVPSPQGEYAFVGDPGRGTVAHAVSSNGNRVVWSYKPTSAETIFEIRDMVEEKTVQIGDRHALFQTMSADGSRIFYLDEGDLHVLNFETGQQTDITSRYGPGETSARVLNTIVGVGQGGKKAYFVAKGVLANGASPGEANLYVASETGGQWNIALIAKLSMEDEKDWFAENPVALGNDMSRITSRVSPNGRFVAFMSARTLTGYDNADANSEQPDEEVYLYDSLSARLLCVSCNPTGARPMGVLYTGAAPLVDKQGAWMNHWIAASISGWNKIEGLISTYQPRYLLDDGRVFFDSSDALATQDTNGTEDVYEYEPVGKNCGVSSAAYSERNGGCLSLVSSGTSSAESAFYDASESGGDAFFVTSARLAPADRDKSFDVYDARVCSAAEPCQTSAVLPPPPCSTTEACRSMPAVQPETFGPLPSTTFSGTGNVPTSFAKWVANSASSMRLGRARKQCRKRYRHRHRRLVHCERTAQKRYEGKDVRKVHSSSRSYR